MKYKVTVYYDNMPDGVKYRNSRMYRVEMEEVE